MTPLLLTAALAAGHHPKPVPVPVFAPPPAIAAFGFAGPGFGPPPFAQPLTIEEFVKCFQPFPGAYRVTLIHPKTCKPVTVCFELPDCGCPPKVRSGRRYVEFDYGKREVEILFRHNGTVDVDYD